MPQKETIEAFDDIVNRINTNVATMPGQDIAVLANLWPLLEQDGAADYRKRLTRYCDLVGAEYYAQQDLITDQTSLAVSDLAERDGGIEFANTAASIVSDGKALIPFFHNRDQENTNMLDRTSLNFERTWQHKIYDESSGKTFVLRIERNNHNQRHLRFGYYDPADNTYHHVKSFHYDEFNTEVASVEKWRDMSLIAGTSFFVPLRKSDDPNDVRICVVDMVDAALFEHKMVFYFDETDNDLKTSYTYANAEWPFYYNGLDLKDKSLVLRSLTNHRLKRLYWDKEFDFNCLVSAGAEDSDPVGVFVDMSSHENEVDYMKNPDDWFMFSNGQTTWINQYHKYYGPNIANDQFQGGAIGGIGRGYPIGWTDHEEENNIANSLDSSDSGGLDSSRDVNLFTSSDFLADGNFTPLGRPPYGFWLVNPTSTSDNIKPRRITFWRFTKNYPTNIGTTTGSFSIIEEETHWMIQDARRNILRRGITKLPRCQYEDAVAVNTGLPFITGACWDETNDFLFLSTRQWATDTNAHQMKFLGYAL